jgi:hypothetical protein
MDKHNNSFRGFVWSNKAWYSHIVELDEVMFGMYSNGGGTTGEMAMRWYELNNKFVPKLEAFDDAWDALCQFNDVLQVLAIKNNKNITPKQFVEILKGCGFKDLTAYAKD